MLSVMGLMGLRSNTTMLQEDPLHCIYYDKNYLGSPLKKVKIEGQKQNNNYGKTKTAAACQVICQETPKCAWFNWDRNQTCYLKTSMGTKSKEEPGGATGPGFCLGK